MYVNAQAKANCIRFRIMHNEWSESMSTSSLKGNPNTTKGEIPMQQRQTHPCII